MRLFCIGGLPAPATVDFRRHPRKGPSYASKRSHNRLPAYSRQYRRREREKKKVKYIYKSSPLFLVIFFPPLALRRPLSHPGPRRRPTFRFCRVHLSVRRPNDRLPARRRRHRSSRHRPALLRHGPERDCSRPPLTSRVFRSVREMLRTFGSIYAQYVSRRVYHTARAFEKLSFSRSLSFPLSLSLSFYPLGSSEKGSSARPTTAHTNASMAATRF